MANQLKTKIKLITPVLQSLRNPCVALTLVSIMPWIFLGWLAYLAFELLRPWAN